MTYGLGGCTAIIIYNKTKQTFTMAHDPSTSVIANIIKQHQNDDITLYSRTRQVWMQNYDGKWVQDEFIPGLEHFNDIPNIKWTKSFYSLTCTCDIKYDTSLYAKFEDNQLMYTDEWGCWKTFQ